MRLPSRWVTNPGSTLKAKSGPHSEVRSFFVPADMGRGCIGHPPAQVTVRPPRGREITTGLRLFAGGRECFLPLAPAHAEGAQESGRRQQDTPPGREEEFTKGESPQKGRGEVQERQCGEGGRGDSAGETVQGRSAGEAVQHTGKSPQKRKEKVQGKRCREDGAGERRCSTPGKSRTARPRNKDHGLHENHDLPGKPGSP